MQHRMTPQPRIDASVPYLKTQQQQRPAAGPKAAGFPAIMLALLVLVAGHPAFAAILPHDKISNGGYILVAGDRVIEQYRATEQFIPASTIKLLTAYTALKTLGPGYRFTTEFAIDDNQVLYVKGGGDPVLTTESLAEAAWALRQRGVTVINGYVLDDTAFALEHPLPDGSENSSNPYDVANSSLAVNFNSIALQTNKSGRILSGEETTPLTPLGREIGALLAPGKHRVNIDAFDLKAPLPLPLRYTAELLHELLKREGVVSRPAIRRGAAPPQARMVYSHRSPQDLAEIVRSCLHVSNNFIANQLALTAGAQLYGGPATWAKAQRALSHFAQARLGITARELQVIEGSGLSRQTRITPMAMVKLLRAFQPYRPLLPEKFGAQLKSGTMTDVYCYAGYLDSPDGAILFVLLLNQPENTRKELLTSLTDRFVPANWSPIRLSSAPPN